MYSKGLLIQLDELNVHDPNEFWRQINKFGPNKTNQIPWIVKKGDEMITEQKQVLFKWHDDFENLYTISSESFDTKFKAECMNKTEKLLEEAKMNSEEHVLDREISYKEVCDAVFRAKQNKAPGIDTITNELLKKDEIVKILQKLYNLCLKHQIIPDEWQKMLIHPIPKENGFLADPLKYRGLALQCCTYKILSHVMNVRLIEYLESGDVLMDEQNGFRKQRSCLHHIYSSTSMIRTRLSKKLSLFSTFIDFKKAFDVTDRQLLYCRLIEYGITGNFLGLIQQMYTSTSNQIRLNGHLTPVFYSKNGVKQGDNLSPSLFCPFINDLVVTLKNLRVGINVNNDIINCLQWRIQDFPEGGA